MLDDIKQTAARIKSSSGITNGRIYRHNITYIHVNVKHVWGGDLQNYFSAQENSYYYDISSPVDLKSSSVGLSRDMCVGTTIDGAANLKPLALAAKEMVPVLHRTLKDLFQIGNYIKRSAKNTQCFQKLRSW